MTVKEYLETTFNEIDEYHVRKAVKCADGFRVSIQGGTFFHYCRPKLHCNQYECVELGFPSMQDDLIMEYAEDETNPTRTVYGYVPIEVVENLIQKHGGIVGTV